MTQKRPLEFGSAREFFERRREILGEMQFKHPLDRAQLDELSEIFDRGQKINSVTGSDDYNRGLHDGLTFSKMLITLSCESKA